jgi:hypothetical protein
LPLVRLGSLQLGDGARWAAVEPAVMKPLRTPFESQHVGNLLPHDRILDRSGLMCAW